MDESADTKFNKDRFVIMIDHNIVWLDVTVNDALLMHLLDSFDHLMSNQEYCLKIEIALARLE